MESSRVCYCGREPRFIVSPQNPWKGQRNRREKSVKTGVILGAVLFCGGMPLLFPAPPATLNSTDEFAALAVSLGPGRYFLGPESLLVTGTDTLHGVVTSSRPLLPPRNPGVIVQGSQGHRTVFSVLPGYGP